MTQDLIRKADPSAVYYLPAARREALVAAATRARLRVIPVEITPSMNTGELLERLGEALKFPDWYGANFDALHDCLCDPDCLPAKGIVLLIAGSAQLHLSDPHGLSTLIEVFQAAGSELRKHGRALWVLLDSRTGNIGELHLA